MRTLADLKRRIVPGVRLRCISNTYRPMLDGTIREVSRTQGNAFTWIQVESSGVGQKESWTYYPKARGLQWLDDNTFRLQLNEKRPEHTVTLAFLEGVSA